MVGKIGFADSISSGASSLEIIIYTDTAHCIVNGRVDHHWFFISIDVGNLFVHLEKVTISCFDDLLSESFDSCAEVEKYPSAGIVYAETCVTTLFSCA